MKEGGDYDRQLYEYIQIIKIERKRNKSQMKKISHKYEGHIEFVRKYIDEKIVRLREQEESDNIKIEKANIDQEISLLMEKVKLLEQRKNNLESS